MENNKCSNCGMTNENNFKFCTKCGKALITNPNTQTSTQTEMNEKAGNQLGALSLILYFAGSTIATALTLCLPEKIKVYFSALSGFIPLIGIVIMIIGRVNYPNNKLLKIAMWLIIASIVICVITIMIIFAWCYITCVTMDTSGCS